MIFRSIQEFRNNATSEDKQVLADYLNASPKKNEALPTEKYNFSYTSASTYLRDEGYQVGRGSCSVKEENEIEEFIIRSSEPKEFVARSVVLQKDIVERLDKISGDNWQYSKKAVINKLLDDALKKYGY